MPDPVALARPLRVAVVGEYPISEDAIQEGGVQSATYALVHALARRDDVECHVIAAMNGATTRYRQVGQLHVHYVRRLPIPRLVSMRLHDVPALVSVIRSIKPDVVHGEGQDRHGMAALSSGVPCVITPHGVLFIEARIHRRHKFDLVGVFRQAKDMIIISRYLPQIYGALLQGRAHFIENPIDQQFFKIARAPQTGRLLFIGTVVPRKRVHDLVAAVAELLRMSEGTPSAAAWRQALQFRIAGPVLDAGSEAQVRAAIEASGLQARVSFLGPISQEQLLEEYACAQVLLLASREETAPQVIAQGMACGLPTVASAAAGIPYMIADGESGLLFPLSDLKACARQIYRLLDDASLRASIEQRITREGRERFHPDSVAAQTVAVYRQVFAGG
jgi:glycosyltransferase involved in cell wall biosynthesis